MADSTQSGLSGPADVQDPEAEEKPKNLFARLRSAPAGARGAWLALRRVMQLVWEASRALTFALALASVIAGIMPAVTAYAAKLLINSVVHAIVVHSQHFPDRAQLVVPILFTTLKSPVLTTIGVIILLAVIQFVIYAVNSLLSTARNISQQLLQERVSMRIQLLVMEHAARLDLPFFEDPASYDLLRQAQTDSINRPVQMISAAFGLIQTALTFVTMVALLLTVSPLLALIALVAPIPQFISDSRYGWRGFMMARWASPLLRRMAYLVTLVTTDTYAKEVKLFSLGSYFINRYRLLAQTYYDRQRALVSARYTVGYVWGVLSTLAGSLTYLYIALQAVAGRLTLGDLTLYTQAATAVQSSIQGLLGGFENMFEHNLYLSNLFRLLEVEPRITTPEKPVPLPEPVKGRIDFEHVTFRYPGSEKEALHDLNFTIEAGETIAVVGRNGAGKTTLVKLLCRLYDPDEGRILLDGIDLREYDPEQLRSIFGGMFQDYATYQATAAENIGLGSLEKIEDRPAVQSAAEKGGASEVIERLPEGYETMLGKWFGQGELHWFARRRFAKWIGQGVNLSGGEWQKVALARAFMRDARILILDEPTSALDAQAEYDLFARLRSLSADRTAVYISHRFSTVRQADRILFLELGQLVEEGTHEQLMRLNGRYARLFRMQASAYTGEAIPSLEEAL